MVEGAFWKGLEGSMGEAYNTLVGKLIQKGDGGVYSNRGHGGVGCDFAGGRVHK